MVKLTHSFLRRCISPEGMFKGPSGKRSYKLTTFLSRLRKQAKKFAVGNDEEQKYKGDGWELFTEYLIRVMGLDKRVGLVPDSYIVEDECLDYGVDGYGTGLDNKPMTVQCKCYIADTELKYNAASLGNFGSQSFSEKYNVSNVPGPNGKCNLLVVTSCKGLHYSVIKDALPWAKCLGLGELRVLVDNNKPFWEQFEESWYSSLGENSA